MMCWIIWLPVMKGFAINAAEDLNNMMRKATVISQTSEKQRNIFFGILLAKIEDRLKKV